VNLELWLENSFYEKEQ